MKMKNCNNCERRIRHKYHRGWCEAFTYKPENCWAWTNDPKWLEKVEEDVERYKMIHADK